MTHNNDPGLSMIQNFNDPGISVTQNVMKTTHGANGFSVRSRDFVTRRRLTLMAARLGRVGKALDSGRRAVR